MTTIKAELILRSRGPEWHYIHTLQARYPKCIHGEAKTHRLMYIGDSAYEFGEEVGLMDEKAFSRNASSSRAIPVNRMIEDVMRDPYIPVHWGKNQPGMQALAECSELVHIGKHGRWFNQIGDDMPEWTTSERAWLLARDNAVNLAASFAAAGYHKQIVNRLIEPWAHINVVITATNWSNFLTLRDHKDAQPEIRMLAQAIRAALHEDTPKTQELKEGEWHLPYVQSHEHEAYHIEQLKEFSVARVARVSYLTHEGKSPSPTDDMQLYDRLRQPPLHASPFEHQAKADAYERGALGAVINGGMFKQPMYHGNFTGFIQHRKLIPGESVR